MKIVPRRLLLASAAANALAGSASAALSFNVATTGWPNATHRDAAVAAAQSSINRYNAYGDFGNYNVHVYYNSGIPTAQANYLGSIGFGQTYPNERVMMHEMAHYLGSGTYGNPWNGARGEALVDQFDGIEAGLNGDSAHFWPYGLNYDSEGSEINKQRQVALLYAQRADMGIGSTANPWSATLVTQTASDALDESGFNYASKWSDGRFAHAGAAYFTGSNTFRTPTSANSFSFAGDSLTVNNTNGIAGGMLYKGIGSTGAVHFKQLNIAGGYVRHASGTGDLFRLAGKVTLTGSSTVSAAQGSIQISASMTGTGSLTKAGGFPLILTGTNTYSGATTISSGILRLSPPKSVASYTFDSFTGNQVINGGTGAGMNGTLANGANIVPGGKFGNAVSLGSGASVDINSPILDMGSSGAWTVSAWVKTNTPGASILSKSDGGWGSGNTIFYLGDGSAGGSGGIPSAVRWGGGFFQGAPGTSAVNDGNWHLVNYVNNYGDYAVYVDGVAQTLSPGNNKLSNDDIGSIVRLGFTTNTVPSDGTVNYNGLLDSVQFYAEALSASQIAAIYQGRNFQVLPETTAVSIASGATLDVNGITQQIAALNGVSGSFVTLGAGQLIVNSAGNSAFAGAISGAGGSMVKAGSGELILSGTSSYTGATTINGGTLRLTASAFTPITGVSASGAVLNGGKLVMDYTGGSSPKSLLVDDPTVGTKANAANPATGRLRTALTTDNTKAIGWLDDGVSVFQARYTHKGDIDLDGIVTSVDFNTFAAGYGKSGNAIWADGDNNYDGAVNTIDFNFLVGNFGLAAVGGSLPGASLGSVIPEPSTLMVVPATGFFIRRRRLAML